MNFLSNINVQGDISFSGNLIGNLPSATASTELYNSVKDNNGLYSAFGYEDIKSENIIQHNILTPIEALNLINTITSGEKPNEITCHTWNTKKPNNDMMLTTVTYIPTKDGHYILQSNAPLDTTGGLFGSVLIYFSDTGGTPIILSFNTSPNDNITDWTSIDKVKTNYNSVLITGRHKVEGVSEDDVSTYNAPFASASPIIVYVQSDSEQELQTDRTVTQFVISSKGLYLRSATQSNDTGYNFTEWVNVTSTDKVPRFSNVVTSISFTAPDKTYNNAVRYSNLFSIPNPLGVASINGSPINLLVETKLNHYFTDSQGNVLDTKLDYVVWSTTNAQISFKVYLTIFGTPTGAYLLANDSQWPSPGVFENVPVAFNIILGSM